MTTSDYTINDSGNRMHLLIGASLTTLLLVIGVFLLTFQPGTAAATDSGSETKSFIVTLDESVVNQPSRKVDDLEEQIDFESEHVFTTALEGFSAELTQQQVEELEDLNSVVSVTPDYRIQRLGWENRRSGEEAPPGVRRVGAADRNRVRQAGSGVAVIDDGIDLNHPDLNAKHGINCSNSPGSSSMPEQGDSHGTHVAGTIGARNNGRGVVGVAPNTPVHAVKVLSVGGEETVSNVLCGINWVTKNAEKLGIKVINMSLIWNIVGSRYYPSGRTCGTTNDPARKAICNLREKAGVTVVVAAGNESWAFDELPGQLRTQGASFPAVYPEVITVTAMNDSDGVAGEDGRLLDCGLYYGGNESQLDDWFANFSNYAETPLGRSHTVAAPGACVKSTLRGGNYGYASGTSMASPHVAGLVASCYAENGVEGRCSGLTPDQVADLIMWESKSLGQATPNSGFYGDPLNPTPMDWASFGYLAPKHGGLPRPAGGYPQRHVPETNARLIAKKKLGKKRLWKITVQGQGMNAVYGTRLDRLECRIDRKQRAGSWTPCPGGRVLTRLGKGRHVIQVRAIADTGSVDPTPARQVVRLGR